MVAWDRLLHPLLVDLNRQCNRDTDGFDIVLKTYWFFIFELTSQFFRSFLSNCYLSVLRIINRRLGDLLGRSCWSLLRFCSALTISSWTGFLLSFPKVSNGTFRLGFCYSTRPLDTGQGHPTESNIECIIQCLTWCARARSGSSTSTSQFTSGDWVRRMGAL